MPTIPDNRKDFFYPKDNFHLFQFIVIIITPPSTSVLYGTYAPSIRTVHTHRPYAPYIHTYTHAVLYMTHSTYEDSNTLTPISYSSIPYLVLSTTRQKHMGPRASTAFTEPTASTRTYSTYGTHSIYQDPQHLPGPTEPT